jgi:outer membrane protein TolC
MLALSPSWLVCRALCRFGTVRCCVVLILGASGHLVAQTPSTAPAGPIFPNSSEQKISHGGGQTAPVSAPSQTLPQKPEQVPAPAGEAEGQVVSPGPENTIEVNFQNAIERALIVNQQYQTVAINARLAREDAIQTRAALLPSVNQFNQYIWTEANGTPSGVYVANDGVHVYTNQAIMHGDIYSPAKRAEHQRALAAEAVARARVEIAARGLIATVIQNYYGLLSAQRKYANAQQSVSEASQFVDITRKQEQGGEVAHSDVIKAEIQLEQRQREARDGQLLLESSRIGLGVLLFPNYGQRFSVVDDLEALPLLTSYSEAKERAVKNNPDIRAAEATLRQETLGISVARASLYPTLSVDYFFGINANQYATYNRYQQENLGSSAQGTLTIPVWSWGAARSKVRQAELRRRQADLELSAAHRQLLGNLEAFYLEAQAAGRQLDSLRRSLGLASESLRLTLLRYQAGEVSVLEVVDAQSTLAQARNASADGLVRYRVAIGNLQTLTGAF